MSELPERNGWSIALGSTSQIGIVGGSQTCAAAAVPVAVQSQPQPQTLKEPTPVLSVGSLGTSVYFGSGYYARIVSVTS